MDHKDAVMYSCEIKTSAYVLAKLSKEQIESVTRLAERYKAVNIIVTDDTFRSPSVEFTLCYRPNGSYSQSDNKFIAGLIEDDGSVHT